MEKDGEDYYRGLIEQTTNPGLRTILTMLADDEVKHYNTLEKMQAQEVTMAETMVLAESKNIFTEIKESHEIFKFDIGQIELYRKAQDIEQKSRRFYLEKVEEVPYEYQMQLFLKLAEEEKKHFIVLENIVNFISAPQFWLENAEFCHLDDY